MLVPEGVWSAGTFLELTPSQGQVEAVLTRMLVQARRSFEALDAPRTSSRRCSFKARRSA